MSTAELMTKHSLRLMGFLQKLRDANSMTFQLVVSHQAQENTKQDIKLLQNAFVYLADKYKLSLDVNDEVESFLKHNSEQSREELVNMIAGDHPELAQMLRSFLRT